MNDHRQTELAAGGPNCVPTRIVDANERTVRVLPFEPKVFEKLHARRAGLLRLGKLQRDRSPKIFALAIPRRRIVGFAGALSGPASFVGVEIKRGAEIAIDEINAKGGIKGRKLVLISRDDEHNPVKTVAQYRELVERERVVGIVGATNSASMLAVAPIVNDTLKVPVICPATDATEITENEAQKQGRDNYLFRVGMYGTGQANFMVDTMVKKFGHNKVGLLTWTGGWGVTGRGELRRRLKENGLSPVGDETFDNNDTDMTPQIIKLKNAGAQSILNYALVRENTFVVKTKEKLNDGTPYVSAWGIAGPAFWKAAGSSATGKKLSAAGARASSTFKRPPRGAGTSITSPSQSSARAGPRTVSMSDSAASRSRSSATPPGTEKTTSMR